MSRLVRTLMFAVPVLVAAVVIAVHSGVSQADDPVDGEETFPQGKHWLLPPPFPLVSDPTRDADNEHVAYGAVSMEPLEQPIAYSHMLHAGDDEGQLGIECQYCHFNARRSKHAGVPSSSTCGNCHNHDGNESLPAMTAGVDSQVGGPGDVETALACEQMEAEPECRPELVKLANYIESDQPIPWRKVHDLPDFVYFTHKRHVMAGVECQECHGEVQDTMTVARRVAELNMGWCLDCHEEHSSVDENYGSLAELRRAEMKDCWTCHQ